MYAVSDNEVNSDIDSTVPQTDRFTLARVLHQLPPTDRGLVMLKLPDGRVLMNHPSVTEKYLAKDATQPGPLPFDGMGGEMTGEFRRVALVNMGVISISTFVNGACVVGAVNEPTDDAYVLIGPIVPGSFGVDIGLQVSKAAKPTGTYEPYFTTSSSKTNMLDISFPCGATYILTAGLFAYYDGTNPQPTMTMIEASYAYALPGQLPIQPITAMQLVPISTLAYDGSNSRMRRMTGIAQPTANYRSKEYFGFPKMPYGTGPDLSNPNLSYESTTYQSYTTGGQVTSAIATSELSPNNTAVVIVSPDPQSTGNDYNDYEGISDNN